jgi:MSHA biogenesis protein MshQ
VGLLLLLSVSVGTATPTATDPAVVGETGSVTLDSSIDDNVVETVSLNYSYHSPVVVVYIPTRNSGETIDARVKNVQSDSFEVFMEEPDNQGHATETVSWIVMEEGEYTLSDGTMVEAGTLSTDSVHGGGDSFGGPTVSFDWAFSSSPVVVHSLNSYNNEEFMSSVSTGIGIDGFQLEQEAMETGISASEETIGWIAFENIDGPSTVNGSTYYVDRQPGDGDNDGVEDSSESLSYSFDSQPDVVVDTQTATGDDGMIARGAGTYTASEASFYAEEDRIRDGERTHTDTGFGMVAVASGTVLKSDVLDDSVCRV